MPTAEGLIQRELAQKRPRVPGHVCHRGALVQISHIVSRGAGLPHFFKTPDQVTN